MSEQPMRPQKCDGGQWCRCPKSTPCTPLISAEWDRVMGAVEHLQSDLRTS